MASKKNASKTKEVKQIVKKPEVKKKIKTVVEKGKAYINATFNNTIVSITDLKGNVIGTSSGGSVGFKGSRKSTPYAASRAAEDAVKKALRYNLKEVSVFLSGPGPGKQMAVKGLRAGGIRVSTLTDTTPIPHNGCRPRKRPRN